MNSDIHQNVALKPDDLDWQKAGEHEKSLLDNPGWESSFLKIAPGSSIQINDRPSSTGEEYLVLEGSLKFENVDYPSGSYLRFPPSKTRKLSSGPNGALVFFKHGHFQPSDQQSITLKQDEQDWRQGMVPGLSVMPLHQHGHESIAFVKWAPNTNFNPHVHPGGEEIIVLEGTFHDEFGSYPQGTWIRNKPYSKHTPYTKSDGATIYVKTGHLEPLS